MIELTYLWTWIRDKEIIIQGNEWRGMIMIVSEDGKLYKLLGYERVEDEEEE